MERKAVGVAALLGSGLAITWMFGLGYHASSWLNWIVLACGIVALGGLGPVVMDTMAGIATWPVVGVVLLAVWLFGLALNATPWLTWVCLAFGCAFVLLSVVYTVATSHLDFHDYGRHAHGHA